ncbi:hypothetical protein GGD65_004086 [Bradyrhizobium sp. CIR18]|uniref:hypothetical protein n=1 Tax=Bradyrhizobium sp. CIR18 TaxID=2663839 RepID=UPI00160626F1|nr:hypothetical protein [Bradyrhizobium sp. CIR18]MBB4363053.1 hypothetical protein [Bradyrhizobium sp. CIR18]
MARNVIIFSDPQKRRRSSAGVSSGQKEMVMPIDPNAHERARLMTGEEPPFGVTSEQGDTEQARNLPQPKRASSLCH